MTLQRRRTDQARELLKRRRLHQAAPSPLYKSPGALARSKPPLLLMVVIEVGLLALALALAYVDVRLTG